MPAMPGTMSDCSEKAQLETQLRAIKGENHCLQRKLTMLTEEMDFIKDNHVALTLQVWRVVNRHQHPPTWCNCTKERLFSLGPEKKRKEKSMPAKRPRALRKGSLASKLER
eukprot:1147499-Pelagomonas_calceolata.AAC.1